MCYLALLRGQDVVVVAAVLQGISALAALGTEVAGADVGRVGEAAGAVLHSVKPGHPSVRFARDCMSSHTA